MRALHVAVLLVAGVAAVASASLPGINFAGSRRNVDFAEHGTSFQKMGFPGAQNCTTHWFPNYIDHFSFGQPSGAPQGTTMYNQRFLTYDKYYKPGGPIFFYVGNELNIEVFANIAGLMWQNAEEFNATLVFAEHRFFGQSQPCDGNFSCWTHLSTMQALADYAVLLTNLTDKASGMYKDSKGIISFGGSYGGMLSAYIRIKYPNLVTGAIAASGPVGMVSSAYRRSSYWQVVTNDATAFGGSAPNCAYNVYQAIQAVFAMQATAAGRTQLQSVFKTCSNIPTGDKGKDELGIFIQSAFDLLAMGDYPIALNFIFGTIDHPAPAWPMRVACEHMKTNTTDPMTMVQNLYDTIAVVYNVTQDTTCNDIAVNPTTGSHWNYMVCSERIINEVPYFEAEGWPNDMFYPQQPWTHERFDALCSQLYGVTPRWGWLNTTYGADNVGGATNIVFSNGLLDPWHSGGILTNVSDTVKSYIIPQGAHHLDLLFDVPENPPLVKWVKSEEVRHIRKWLREM